MHAGRCALARGVEAGKLGAPVEVGDDAADRVVRGRRDRDRALGRVVALIGKPAHERREATAVDLPQVEERGAARGDLARDDIARGELVGEALAALVEERRALAAQRLAQQERGIDESRRVELRELEVGDGRAGSVSGRYALAHCAGRVRRALPESGRASGREQGRARGHGAGLGDDAHAAAAGLPHGLHPLPLGNLDPRMLEHALRKPPRDAVARRRTARMHDAAAAVATLEAEVVVELDPELHEIPDPRGCLSRERCDRARPREPASGAERVVRMERRRVVGADGGRDPALGKQAGRREQRALGEDEDATLGGGAEGCEETGNASTDHEEVEVCVRGGLRKSAHGSFRL